MRGFTGYKDKRALVKRAPGAIAGRFLLGSPIKPGFYLFAWRRVLAWPADAGGECCAANRLNFFASPALPSPSVVKLIVCDTEAQQLSLAFYHKSLCQFCIITGSAD